MENRGYRSYADFSERPSVDGSLALQPQAHDIRPRLQLVTLPTTETTGLSLGAKLSSARDIFTAKERGKNKLVKAYEVEQDAVLYRVLAQEKGKDEYAKAKEDLDAYMKMQLETHLGERLHVGISRFTHTITDGELRVKGTDESLLEMLKRGRDYRREHGDPIDWDRESAEVIGFGRIQQVLADHETPIGTMMFFVSPPGDKGSIYRSNFYDVHMKVSDTEVVSHRYTSGLTPKESQQRLKVVDKRYDTKEVPTAAEFILNPVLVKPGTKGLETPDAVHKFMHVDHKHMNRHHAAIVKQACQPLIKEYIQSLLDDPDNLARHKMQLDMLMNYADNVAEELLAAPENRVVALSEYRHDNDIRPWVPPVIDRNALAAQQVRVADTGCGSSGANSNNSVFSVAEAGNNTQYTGENAANDPNLCRCGGNEPHFHCPGKDGACQHAIVVGKGISSCPQCGAGQTC